MGGVSWKESQVGGVSGGRSLWWESDFLKYFYVISDLDIHTLYHSLAIVLSLVTS